MSATPIPRTLLPSRPTANVAVSSLRTKPPGREPVGDPGNTVSDQRLDELMERRPERGARASGERIY